MSRSVRVLTLLLVLALAATGCWGGEERYEIEAHFDRTFNLFEGSRVRVLGVDVGRVETVDVSPGRDTVRTRLRIDPEIKLPEDVRARIVTEALLGERYVQLDPPYTDGPELAAGAVIPIDRTSTPVEFEESFETLNHFIESLDEQELGRLVDNLAEVLDGQGETLGETIDDVRDIINALRESDEELVQLAGTLADLNETVATRSAELGEFFADFNTLAESLASDRAAIDEALRALARMTRVLGDLLADHRDTLEADIATLTRFARTTNRNLDQFALFLEGQAELFRHAERVVQRDKNWLPILQHETAYEEMIADRLTHRLVGLCLRLEIDACADAAFWEGEIPDELCLEPVVPCPEEGSEATATPLEDALEDAVDSVPEIRERLDEEGRELEEELDDVGDGALPDEDVGDSVDDVTGGATGGRVVDPSPGLAGVR